MSGNQSLVHVFVSANILSLNGDQILGSVKAVNDLVYQIGVLILQSMPPYDGDGLGDFIHGCICGLGRFLCGSCGFSRGCRAAGGAAACAQGEYHAQYKSQCQ